MKDQRTVTIKAEGEPGSGKSTVIQIIAAAVVKHGWVIEDAKGETLVIHTTATPSPCKLIASPPQPSSPHS